MSTTSAAIVTDESAWFSLEYSLTVQDLTRLGWLRSRMDAVVLLGERGLADGDHAFARRLAFVKHLATTGRMNEEARP